MKICPIENGDNDGEDDMENTLRECSWILSMLDNLDDNVNIKNHSIKTIRAI